MPHLLSSFHVRNQTELQHRLPNDQSGVKSKFHVGFASEGHACSIPGSTYLGNRDIHVSADSHKSCAGNQGTVTETSRVSISVNSWDSEVTLGTSSFTNGKIFTGGVF